MSEPFGEKITFTETYATLERNIRRNNWPTLKLSLGEHRKSIRKVVKK